MRKLAFEPLFRMSTHIHYTCEYIKLQNSEAVASSLENPVCTKNAKPDKTDFVKSDFKLGVEYFQNTNHSTPSQFNKHLEHV
jgi:hypothetical protein